MQIRITNSVLEELNALPNSKLKRQLIQKAFEIHTDQALAPEQKVRSFALIVKQAKFFTRIYSRFNKISLVIPQNKKKELMRATNLCQNCLKNNIDLQTMTHAIMTFKMIVEQACKIKVDEIC